MLSDMPNWGSGGGCGGGGGGAAGPGEVIRRYTRCTLQTFLKQYDSTISSPFLRDSHFSCSRMSVILPVS